MKIIGGFLALAAAKMEVMDCNAGTDGAAAMKMAIDKADIQRDLTDAGWTLEDTNSDGKGDQWQKTETPIPTTVKETGAGDTKMLEFQHKVHAGCKKENVDGKNVCVKTGHTLTFTCSYPMKDQDLTEQAFTVSGSDTEDSVSKQGSLVYKIGFSNKPADGKPYEIGSDVKATITPVTSGLVHATIESCSVKNKGNLQTVPLVSDGMKRECLLGVDVTKPQGNGVLTLQWESFKWNTEHATGSDKAADEDQELSCKISLSKDAPATQAQQPADCAAKDNDAANTFADKACDATDASSEYITTGAAKDLTSCFKECRDYGLTHTTSCAFVSVYDDGSTFNCFLYSTCGDKDDVTSSTVYEI